VLAVFEVFVLAAFRRYSRRRPLSSLRYNTFRDIRVFMISSIQIFDVRLLQKEIKRCSVKSLYRLVRDKRKILCAVSSLCTVWFVTKGKEYVQY
jgi:hypothetical protein